MSMFKQIIYYFSVYKKYIGKRLYIVFILSVIAAVTEGFGIAMLLPLMAVADVGLDGQGLDATGVAEFMGRFVSWFGIEGSMVGILLFISALFLLKGGILFAAQAYQSHLQAQLMREMKTMLFDRYSKMDYGYYCSHNTGHFVNIINSQIGKLISSFKMYKMFLSVIISTAVYLLAAFVMAWDFALMAMFAGFLLLLAFRGVNTYVHHLSRRAAVEQSELNKFLVQTLQAFKYLSSTAELPYLRKGILKSVDRLASYLRGRGIAQALTESLSEPVAILFVLIVIVIQVVVLNAQLVPIFVALLLFNRALGGVMRVQQTWQNVLFSAGSIEMVEKECARLDTHQAYSGNTKAPPLSSEIEFRDVFFAYPGGVEDVLRGITLKITANTTVAFVGESGAGKSTLADMITLLLRPQSDEILIDGVAGHDIDISSWRRQIGYVSQETVVFDDTIANNITLWKDDYATDSRARLRIEEAARQAKAYSFIRALPEGFNSVVGDRGIRLSGGQRQRLFLARELYKNPRLLILDEATSALDSESEQYIQKSIDALKGQMTVVIIAHRLSTIRNADRIFVLDRGRVVQEGAYTELLNQENGLFAQMIAHQSLSLRHTP
jgi:subfamily B ATP-binding cassette protein MsbA